ncbi:hypothetical protein U9M48_016006, partial [Paspalum notatum var. saurae]
RNFSAPSPPHPARTSFLPSPLFPLRSPPVHPPPCLHRPWPPPPLPLTVVPRLLVRLCRRGTPTRCDPSPPSAASPSQSRRHASGAVAFPPASGTASPHRHRLGRRRLLLLRLASSGAAASATGPADRRLHVPRPDRRPPSHGSLLGPPVERRDRSRASFGDDQPRRAANAAAPALRHRVHELERPPCPPRTLFDPDPRLGRRLLLGRHRVGRRLFLLHLLRQLQLRHAGGPCRTPARAMHHRHAFLPRASVLSCAGCSSAAIDVLLAEYLQLRESKNFAQPRSGGGCCIKRFALIQWTTETSCTTNASCTHHPGGGFVFNASALNTLKQATCCTGISR